MGLPDRELGEAIESAIEDDDRRPRRVHALFEDYPPAPALYAEFGVASGDGVSEIDEDGVGEVSTNASERTEGTDDIDGIDASEDIDGRRDGNTKEVAVIVHNFRYYPLGMERWDVGVIELLILNELHELTHWAMTGGEREYFDDRSRRHHRGDGYWLNPPLLEIIDWLPRGHPAVLEGDPPVSWLGRLRWGVGRWLRRQRARLE